MIFILEAVATTKIIGVGGGGEKKPKTGQCENTL